MATFAKTRKVNCDSIKENLSSLIGSWKSGRFLPFSQRPWSINSYALPLVWYRCHCIDLRAGDFTEMSSVLKSCLYEDLLEKPEELMMVKPRSEGGLGVHHIRSKSRAILTKAFLETAFGDKYLRNEYHNALFQWHIMDNHNIQNPGIPPYYSANFFASIKEVY